MKELVYAGKDVEVAILTRWSKAKITNASDEIHRERFEVNIPEVTEDEFYPFAVKGGFALDCLGFQFQLQSLKFPEPKCLPGEHEKTKAQINKWIKLAGPLHK